LDAEKPLLIGGGVAMVSRQSGRDQIHIRYNTEVAESTLFDDLDLNLLDDFAHVVET